MGVFIVETTAARAAFAAQPPETDGVPALVAYDGPDPDADDPGPLEIRLGDQRRGHLQGPAGCAGRDEARLPFVQGLVALLTGGIYTPWEVSVTCGPLPASKPKENSEHTNAAR